MLDLVDNVDSNPDGPRNIGKWFRNGRSTTGLIEWTTAPPGTFSADLATVTERIPVNSNRPEESRTLKIDALFYDGRRTALIYQCVKQPLNLHLPPLNPLPLPPHLLQPSHSTLLLPLQQRQSLSEPL